MECTVNGCYYNLTMIYWEKILHVTFYYPWYMQICSTGVFFFFFSYQCKSTPLQVWKDKKSHVASFPLITPPLYGPTSWPSLSRYDVCRLVDGGSSSGRCLSWKIGCCYFRAHPLFSFSCWIVWPPLKRQGLIYWLVKRSSCWDFHSLSNYVEGKHLL